MKILKNQTIQKSHFVCNKVQISIQFNQHKIIKLHYLLILWGKNNIQKINL